MESLSQNHRTLRNASAITNEWQERLYSLAGEHALFSHQLNKSSLNVSNTHLSWKVLFLLEYTELLYVE